MSKITDLTNTQTDGLCHDKQSELESLSDQPVIDEEIDHPIAATKVPNQGQTISITVNCVDLQGPKS